MVLPRQKQSVGDRAKIESDIWQVFEQHWRVQPAQAFDDGICRPARAAQMLRQSPCFRVPELDGYYPKKFCFPPCQYRNFLWLPLCVATRHLWCQSDRTAELLWKTIWNSISRTGIVLYRVVFVTKYICFVWSLFDVDVCFSGPVFAPIFLILKLKGSRQTLGWFQWLALWKESCCARVSAEFIISCFNFQYIYPINGHTVPVAQW